MSRWQRFMSALRAGITHYNKKDFDASLLDFSDDRTWDSVEARRLRYALGWALYQGTAYNDVNSWGKSFKTTEGLYNYIRAIYNPSAELGNFYAENVWAGGVELFDDDGNMSAQEDGAIPIQTDDDALRAAIAKLFVESNMQTIKSIIPLYGATMGDVAIEVVHDRDADRVYLRPISAAMIAELEMDNRGFVKAYAIEFKRDYNGRSVSYREEVERGGGDEVIYRTYKDNSPFGWNGKPAQWVESYGFIPMVFINHHSIGRDFGVGEWFVNRALFWEVDDQGSKLNDQIRKAVDTKWIVTGANRPVDDVSARPSSGTDRSPQAGREQSPFVYIPEDNVTIAPMVFPLDIAAAGANIDRLISTLESKYPEIVMQRVITAGTELSGVAISRLRGLASRKIVRARSNYDSGMTRAIQMALAIGGEETGIAEYAPFNLGSFQAGALNFTIADRSSFAPEIEEILDNQQTKAETLNIVTASVPDIAAAARVSGYSDSEVEELGSVAGFQGIPDGEGL